MLLNIYLGTIAINWATVLLTSMAIENNLKRKGYTFVKEKKSLSEKIMNFISTIFKGSIPIYNILNTVCILWMGEKKYDFIEKKFLQEGKIYKTTDFANIENDDLQDRSVNLYSDEIKNENTYKHCSEITNEEKLAILEEERKNLLNNQEDSNEQVNPNTNPYKLGRRRK